MNNPPHKQNFKIDRTSIVHVELGLQFDRFFINSERQNVFQLVIGFKKNKCFLPLFGLHIIRKQMIKETHIKTMSFQSSFDKCRSSAWIISIIFVLLVQFYLDRHFSELKIIKLMQQNNSANLSQSNLINQSNLTESVSLQNKRSQVKFTSMLKGEDQLRKKQDYFNSLLNRHPLKLEHVNSFFTDQTESFTTDILGGKYDIKPLVWSAEQQQNRVAAKKKSAEALKIKKSLENELKNIENQLSDEQNPKSSRIISEEQHLNFMKKIENQKRQLLKKRQQALKLQQEQRLQEERRLKQQKQKIQQQKKRQKRKQIEETLRILEQQHKKRMQISKQQQLILKQKLKQKTMVDKIEEQYNLKQNQSLEEKKKRLAEIRALHRPIDKKELDEFAEKLDNIKKQKIAARSNSVQQTLNKSSQVFYKSAFYKKIQKEKKLFEDSKNQQEINKLKEAREKLKKFSEHVKTAYKPTIDEKLVEEMKFRSVNLSKRGRSTSHAVTQTPHKIGLRYLEFSKLQVDHQKLLVSGQQQEPEEQKQPKLDYLAELRKKNKRKEIKSAQDLMEQMEKLNLSKQERQQKILQFTQKLEKKAKQKEQLERMGRNSVDNQLDALYLQAIEAKLSLLDDI